MAFRPRFLRLTPFSGVAVFLLSLVHLTAAAELRGVTETKGPAATRPEGIRVRRYEFSTGKSYEETAQQLQRDRIYAIHNPRFGRWVFVISDSHGKILDPVEALAPGTVVRGRSLGAESGKHYRLTKDVKWVETKDPLQTRVWTMTKIPTFNIFVPFQEGLPRKPASKK